MSMLKYTPPTLLASVAFLLVLFIFSSLATTASPMKVAKILVLKEKRELYLLNKKDEILKSYSISLGTSPVGHKQQQGDCKTPEGEYVIDYHNPKSKYHRSLHISYPNKKDKESARKRGVDPGGNIMIHGLPNGLGSLNSAHLLKDWTIGCIALTNEEIEEVYKAVDDGTPIEIRP